LYPQFFSKKGAQFNLLSIGLLLTLSFFSFLPDSISQEDIKSDSLNVKLDSLNKRRMLPSFLLWQNINTNPLFPQQNQFLPRYSPFYQFNPTESNIQVEMDSIVRYRVREQLDSNDVNSGQVYDFDEFSKIQEYRVRQEYWRSRSKGLDGDSPVGGRNLIPPITTSPSFDRIFGGNEINIVPTGFVNLDLGAIFRRIDNPAIPIRQQQNGNFNFNQQIQMSVIGTLGQKMKIGANFDSNNSFDFQNQLKVEYTGFQEDIIKSIEIGNVSMPIQNSLIQGAQNLFGVKTQMQFGKLLVTGVASTQRGRRDELVIEGGGTGKTI
jgi:cell surface protein SprA